MKRKAYTLAETLITLGIVGVISAMVIPTLVTGHMKQVYAQRLATAVADFENAMATMINAEGVDDLLDTEAWQVIRNGNGYTFQKTNRTDAEKKEFMAKLGKYIALVGYRDSNASMYKELYGDKDFKLIMNGTHYKTKKGIEYIFHVDQVSKNNAKTEVEALAAGCNYQNQASTLYIDINAEEGPNRLGRDLFRYELSTEGKLYPHGSPDHRFFKSNETIYTDFESQCKENKDARYCAEYLAKNGYKMDY